MIQEALFTRLNSFAGLTALIGAGATNCRAYYPEDSAPQNPTYPFVIFFQVSGPRETAMGADPGIVRGRFQFDVYDTDQDSVRDVCEQLRKCLQRWRGTGLGNAPTLQVFDTFIDNEQDVKPELVDSVRLYRKILDVMIDYTES